MSRKILAFILMMLFSISSMSVNADGFESGVKKKDSPQIIQIMIPMSDGTMRILTGAEAEAYYSKFLQPSEQNIAQSAFEELARGDFELPVNEAMSEPDYRYRYVETEKGKKGGGSRRVSPYACNGTSVQQSMETTGSGTINWSVTASLDVEFLKVLKASFQGGWMNSSAFSQKFTINVPSKKRVWLEFNPLVKYTRGRCEKYYYKLTIPHDEVIVTKKTVESTSPTTITASFGGRTFTCPDGAFVWKQDDNYMYN